MKIRVHLFISGLVQGVFFRETVRQQAKANSVTGWVKNLADGRVEVVMEGEESNIDKVVKFCKQGPTGARVFSVEVEKEKFKGEFNYFDIS